MEDNNRNNSGAPNGSYGYGRSGIPQQRQMRPPQQGQQPPQQHEHPWRMPQQPIGSVRVPPMPPRGQQTAERQQPMQQRQQPQQGQRPHPQGQHPQQGPRPQGKRPQQQRPLAHPGVSPVRKAAPVSKRPLSGQRQGYSYNNYGLRPRHRRPTPFLLILIVFAIILLIVVFTSKGFRNLIDSIGRDDTDTEYDTDNENTGKPAESGTDAASGTEEPPETEDPETMPPPEDDLFLIFIDPGHGFGDSGTSSELLGDVLEKDITLDIAKEVNRILSESGYNVMLTHDGNEFPKAPNDDGDALFYIDERVSYVNSKGADLFVSIHCDSFPDNDSVRGTRIYYCSGNKHSEESAKLVDGLKAAIDSEYASYKEVITYGREIANSYYVTAYTECPSALIEVGFVTSPKDAEKMLDDEWKHNMAYLIATAVADYVNALNAPAESE